MNAGGGHSPDRAIRDGLGIPSEAVVALVVYESITEHIFRAVMPELCHRYSHVLVIPMTERDENHLRLTYRGEFENVQLVDSLEIEGAADEIVMFRYLEDFIRTRKTPIRLVDPQNRWATKEVSR